MRASVNDVGNLHFVFKECDDNVVVVHRILNAGEVEFLDDDCVGIELFDFERQINRGKIQNVGIRRAEIREDTFVFHVDVDGQAVNGRLNLTPLKE